MKRIYRKALAIAPWMMLLAGAYLAMHFTVLDEPYLRYTNLPFPIFGDGKVRAGEAVRLVVKRCSSDSVTRVYSVSHTLDGDGPPIMLPATTTSIEPGCGTSVSATNVIPLGTRPGKYVLYGTSEVPGAVRTFVVRWQSAKFEVTP